MVGRSISNHCDLSRMQIGPRASLVDVRKSGRDVQDEVMSNVAQYKPIDEDHTNVKAIHGKHRLGRPLQKANERGDGQARDVEQKRNVARLGMKEHSVLIATTRRGDSRLKKTQIAPRRGHLQQFPCHFRY